MSKCYDCKHQFRSSGFPGRAPHYFCLAGNPPRHPVTGHQSWPTCEAIRETPACSFKPTLIARLKEVFS